MNTGVDASRSGGSGGGGAGGTRGNVVSCISNCSGALGCISRSVAAAALKFTVYFLALLRAAVTNSASDLLSRNAPVYLLSGILVG